MPKSFNFNPQPNKEASDYFRNKGIKPSFHWQDVWAEEHAHAFTVAKAMEMDVLQTIRDDLQNAIDNGVPFKEWQKNLEPKLIEMGWWGQKVRVDPKTGERIIARLGTPRRLRTIYESNIRSARSAGQFIRAQRTKGLLPYFIYGLGPSDVHRPLHVEKEGTILPVDDPFWNEWMPPNGWGCKCHVRQITKREADKNGGVSPPPEIERYEHINKRTGERSQIPVGIDPGWHTNPGKARHQTLAKHLAGELENAPKIQRDVVIKDLLSSFAFQKMKTGQIDGLVPVAVMSKELHETFYKTSNRVVLTHSATIKKLSTKKITDTMYLQIQEIIDTGEAITDSPNNIVFQKKIEGRWMRVIVKASGNKKELLLSSFYILKKTQHLIKRDDGTVLRDPE